MKTAERLNHIQEYFFSRKLQEVDRMRQSGADIINLGIGSPDLPPPPKVIEILCEQAQKKNTHSYQSYRGVPDLRNAMAQWYQRWYGVSIDAQTEILPLIGSKEGIVHISMTYLGNGDEALVPDPGYPTYGTAVELAGANAITYKLSEEKDWFPDFEALNKLDLTRVKLMWVNYPNMPTGKAADKNVFEKLVYFGRKHKILICHDNPYSFILNEKPISILSVEGAKDTAIELNSLSKTYNMAGWRVGMMAGAATVINDVLKFKSNMDSGMFLPVQFAAAEALNTSMEWHREQNAVYLSRRKKAEELIHQLGGVFDREQTGMFLWARVPKGFKDGIEFCDYLLQQRNIFITPGSVFGEAGKHYFRVSLCCPEERITDSINRITNNKTQTI
ncbi:MAG: aminotransferase class I/II-fold pyridoxal phosphate-dependent enzyme [Bacteroidota bacterium]